MAQSVNERLLRLISGYCRIQSVNMNIIDGIIRIIYEYNQIATWSKEFKGDSIELSQDDTKATCVEAIDCGHFLPEEAPGETLDAIAAFLS